MSKTANVVARIDPGLKEEAEGILARLGLPVSTFITMAYHQIVLKNGVPFDVTLPARPKALDELTKAEFDAMMEQGLKEAAAGVGVPLEKAFSDLGKGLSL